MFKGFQKPKRLVANTETLTERFGQFAAQPFERGFGSTIGTGLRRVLLSSIEGAAITGVRIEGVSHEFSPIPGVVEDATDIILNLKQVPFKMMTEGMRIARLRVETPGEVMSSQIETDADIEVLDRNLHIATVGEGGKLDIEMRIKSGRGYVSADRNYDDTHLWIRPTSVLGLGKEKDFINDAGNTAAEVILVPVICLFECIFGGCSKCKSDARKAADTINPVDEIEGWIPGVGDISGNDWVGLWHHINMNDGASNEFDAHQGEFFEEAGPPGMGMDPVDLVLMAVMDATGLSVNYNDSNGVHQYQISSSPDGAALTQIRDKSQWQFSTLPHTPFEPVSNLAEYGWRRFFDAPEHSVRNLAWPLHAMGDATVPMHVVATSAWGHRPYEDSQEYLWPQITLQNSQDQQQIDFINRVMQRAFIWNGKILAWRIAHGNSKDVPVRDIVTELAGNTHAYSLQMQTQTGGTWPFSVVASTAYLLEPSGTSKLYASIPGAADKARPLYEDGMGAIVALLVAASDSFPPQ